jgi:hypothetical protein
MFTEETLEQLKSFNGELTPENIIYFLYGISLCNVKLEKAQETWNKNYPFLKTYQFIERESVVISTEIITLRKKLQDTAYDFFKQYEGITDYSIDEFIKLPFIDESKILTIRMNRAIPETRTLCYDEVFDEVFDHYDKTLREQIHFINETVIPYLKESKD